ncbi:MAG: hypothetical protein KDI55_25385, partial [Anaerolineae bacterium]|nr:hypothetical protein [Anaerolineae bacterium]
MLRNNRYSILMAAILILALSGIASANASGPQAPEAPVSTAFTYQGRLVDNGLPANGAYDLRFSLFDDAVAGAQIGSTQTLNDVTVTDGYFTVSPDFGTGVFQGDARWIQVEVRPGASTGSYTPLSPRTELAGAPYALSLRPGATVNTSQADVPAITVGAPNANSNALVATGNADGYAVVYGEDQSTAGGFGVFGKSTAGTGVYGTTSAGNNSGNTSGVEGFSSSSTGVGVRGTAPGFTGQGVLGTALGTDGTGVRGQGGYYGVYGEGDFYGIKGTSTDGWAVHGQSVTGIAVAADSSSTHDGAEALLARLLTATPGASSAAVYAANNGTGASGIGVWGTHNGTGYGVYGQTTNGGYAVVGDNGGSNTSGYAGSFNGRVAVIGTLTKGGGSFKIDHPLDPANKYLYHSFVESPDMMNIYNGNVTTDADGFATVTMPDWFEALNQDFRYQLTVIGQFSQAIVAEEVSGNQFRIQTDKPGVKVSWQVTGIRHDPFAEAYRIPVEEDKTSSEKGHYLYPEVYGKPVQDSVWYASSP